MDTWMGCGACDNKKFADNPTFEGVGTNVMKFLPDEICPECGTSGEVYLTDGKTISDNLPDL